MARIAGIDIPKNKRGVIGLTYIYGIGSSRAALMLDQAGISHDKKVNEWNDDELPSIRNFITANIKTVAEFRSEVQSNIKRLIDFGCYRCHL